ncbi:MAG TPA: N-acetylmuramoyl-L-alanine amidase [Planctomycetota bacterium]|nr:N-acetylmuramoyl-L-alanine amidase [Planctomycetota bacterium]
MRPALPAITCALVAAAAPAQQALFFRNHDLAAVPPLYTNVGAAIAHLCAGPTATELAAGYASHIPAGTRLVAMQQQGSAVRLVFDATLLRATTAGHLEDAIEQIDKTALAAPGMHAVHLAIRLADGSEQPLAALVDGPAPTPADAVQPLAAGLQSPFGSLAGKRIAVSPGHGYYWHSTLGWTTQRGLIDGLIEDIHTAEICNQYLIPFLQNLGADVILCREHGEVNVDSLVDNDSGAPGYVETGAWFTSASSGYNGGGYRYASTGPTETATAVWTIPVAKDGLYPVYAWFRASSNRTTEAHYRIEHTGGIDTAIVDQTRDNLTWAHLGDFWFSAAQGARIVLGNQSASPGVCIADTVRLGGGLGSIVRGSGPSNQLRWKECARYWAQFSGAPSSVWDSISGGEDNDDDVTARPRFAEWRTADAFVSLHTNAGGGAGTDTFIYSGGATAGSAALSQSVHTQLITDIRAYWNPAWVDRGQQQANFGEVRLLSTMPGILVELAFHDTPGSLDHTSLHEPEFRYLAARAFARGVLRYFAPLAPFPPEPPTALRVTQDGAHGLRVAWDPAAGATSYTVEQSDDGKGFVEAGSVTSTSWSTGPLPHHTLRSFRVRAWNSTGRSFPTEVLTAGTDHLGAAQALLVQGFDRFDRYVKGPENTRDYLRLFGDALRRDASYSLGFDAASNEAVQLVRVALPNYSAVIWSLGEESTADETFSGIEQSLVTTYLNGGGGLLVSGAEVGWDLDAHGSASDRSFYRNVLGASYVADDAAVYTLQGGIAGTVSAGVPAAGFDNGSFGTYDVDYPDVLAPTDASSTVCLRYGNGLVAGVQKIDPGTGARVVTFGLPLDTITSASARAQFVRQSVAFLLDDLPLRGPATATLGQATPFLLSLPTEAGLEYWLCASLGYQPGLVLPLGSLLPLDYDVLLAASITPGSPFFVDFLGTLSAGGTAAPVLNAPYLPLLAGLPVWFCGFTLSPMAPLERRVTNWVRLTLTL